MNLFQKTLEAKSIFKGKILELSNKKELLPNHKIALREIIHCSNAVCIAALTEKDELIFEKQYRSPLNDVILELPAGKIEKSDKSPLDAAIRELKEETGIISTDYNFLGEFYSTPGFCDEIIYLYSCTVSDLGSTSFDEDEFIETVKIPLSSAVDMVLNNEIKDGKSQALILKLNALKNFPKKSN